MMALSRPALMLFALLSVLTGLVYPLAVTGIGQLVFPYQANGSIVTINGKPAGSELIGQQFTAAGYFWSRPSATSPYAYNAAASSGSNLGPLNPALADRVKARIDALKAADPDNSLKVPIDLVTASASGLDPEISLAAADYQAARVAKARGLAIERVKSLIVEHGEGRGLGMFGEPRVNVLRLNLALDASLSPGKRL